MQNIANGRCFIQAGLWGGYPAATGYRHNIRNTDLLALAAEQKPFPVHEPDPADSALAREIKGDHQFDIETTTLPEVMREGDLYLCMFRGASGLGDPLERPYESVMEDIEGDFLLPRYAEQVYGVVAGDSRATAQRRSEMRDARGAKAIPVREWMERERKRILDRDMIQPVQRMYAESMLLSERWAQEFREFWDLPEDFAFDVPTPEVELSRAILATQEGSA
jgi:hypothetical protein